MGLVWTDVDGVAFGLEQFPHIGAGAGLVVFGGLAHEQHEILRGLGYRACAGVGCARDVGIDQQQHRAAMLMMWRASGRFSALLLPQGW